MPQRLYARRWQALDPLDEIAPRRAAAGRYDIHEALQHPGAEKSRRGVAENKNRHRRLFPRLEGT